MFPESLLHFIWKFQLWNTKDLRLASGERLLVKHPGRHNADAGPDFSDARIEVDGLLWAGNIEIHTRASDWKRHGHEGDQAYKTILLHVVWIYDIDVMDAVNRPIPVLVMKPYVDEGMLSRWIELYSSTGAIPCAHFEKPPSPWRENWLTRICIARLERKSQWIREILVFTSNNWQEAFYIALARGFGMNVNAVPFELLARSLPYAVVVKHRHSRFQLEALFLGQSGLLEDTDEDPYIQRLYAEYFYLKRVYSLKMIQPVMWKRSRMRPDNFPEIRIVQLAALLASGFDMLHLDKVQSDVRVLDRWLEQEVSEYWQLHYRIGVKAPKKSKKPGIELRRALIINALVPFVFVYARYKADEELESNVLSWLENLPAEQNKVTRNWEGWNVKAENAAESQALLELTQSFCEPGRCLDCSWGLYYLKEGRNYQQASGIKVLPESLDELI
jgi:hypothetical protein